ncbi:MAG: type II secretion system GspH family protein, partial [Azoarcus sp.]|nr:type II secretion system GspH family protein [Azoarcus sp.]
MKRQSGFTLIEVVMSIVILGILAATAVPRFTDLSAEAKRALLHAAANALYSASLMNYAGCAMNGFVTEDNKCKSVVQCGD